MYTDLSLYYLQQIGITPWISKNTFELKKNKGLAQKIIVLMQANYSPKVDFFVKKILSFVQAPQENLSLLYLESEAWALSDYQQHIGTLNEQSPLAILSLGISISNLPTTLSCPMITTRDPIYLLDNPSQKKALFADLHSLNTQLMKIQQDCA